VIPPASNPTGYPNVQVSHDPGTSKQVETHIAVNPQNPSNLVAVWIDYRVDGLNPRNIRYAYSFDGGVTWTENLFPPSIAGYPFQGDPTIAVDNDGNFFISFLSFFVSGRTYRGGVFVAKSTDGGQTWPPSLFRRLDSDEVFDDKCWITVDRTESSHGGNVYVAWTHGDPFGSLRTWLARSTDHGMTFDPHTVVSHGPVTMPWGAMPAIGVDGTVYVIWPSGNYEVSHFFLDKSSDGGGSFGEDREITTVYRPGIQNIYRIYAFPFLSINPLTGHLYIAWNSRETPPLFSPNSDVLFIRSTDDGETWYLPINIVNNGVFPSPSRGDQFFPFIVTSHDGAQVFVMYYDRSDFANNDSVHVKVSI